MQFLGDIEAKVDTKARAIVPSAFRKILQSAGEETLVLRKDIFQDCLVLYPKSVWEQELAKLRSRLSRWDRTQQQLFRQFVVDSTELDIDTSGRILISKKYLEMIHAKTDIRFLGVDNTIEIWTTSGLDNTLVSPEDFGNAIESLMKSDNI